MLVTIIKTKSRKKFITFIFYGLTNMFVTIIKTKSFKNFITFIFYVLTDMLITIIKRIKLSQLHYFYILWFDQHVVIIIHYALYYKIIIYILRFNGIFSCEYCKSIYSSI